MKLTEMGVKPTTKQMKKVMESRFGFAVDYNNLTLKKAYTMANAISESLSQVKRTHHAHHVETDPRYMEMFMVRESLHRWMVENKSRIIAESEMAKSQAILAAKDMVDSIQDMLEKISKMQNEQLPALLDTIRDQISTDQAEAFKGSVGPLLQTLSQTLQDGRETADSAARSLAGEQVAQPMDMGGQQGEQGGQQPEMGAEQPAPGGDEFGGTGAAAGGNAELGRAVRGESRNSRKRPVMEISDEVVRQASVGRLRNAWDAEDRASAVQRPESAARNAAKADVAQQQLAKNQQLSRARVLRSRAANGEIDESQLDELTQAFTRNPYSSDPADQQFSRTQKNVANPAAVAARNAAAGNVRDARKYGDKAALNKAGGVATGVTGREVTASRSIPMAKPSQLGELSQGTLSSYAGKARSQADWAGGVSAYGKQTGNTQQEKQFGKLAAQRRTGAKTADVKAGNIDPTQSQKVNPRGYY